MYEKALLPSYSGSVDYKINAVSKDLADEFFTFRLKNKHQDNYKALQDKKFNLTDEEIQVLNELEEVEIKLNKF